MIVIHTNKGKRAFERYGIARIVIKPRGWVPCPPPPSPVGIRGISPHRLSTDLIARAHGRAQTRAHERGKPSIPSILASTPTDLISSTAIPWALTHLPTKEHLRRSDLCNAAATCSQVACPRAHHEFIISLV